MMTQPVSFFPRAASALPPLTPLDIGRRRAGRLA